MEIFYRRLKYSHIFPKCFQPTLLPLILTSLPLFSCQLFLGHIQSTLPLFPLHIFLTTPIYVSPSHSLAAPIIFRQVCIANTTITTSTSNCPHASLCLPIMFQFFGRVMTLKGYCYRRLKVDKSSQHPSSFS